MAFTVSPSSRRLVMGALLVLATAGAIIRAFAPDPSTLRDVGTLLLVLWLPAVGNLIGYLIRKLPRSAPPLTDFAPGRAFAPHLVARIEAIPLPRDFPEPLSATEGRCTLVVGRRAFTVRFKEPLARALASPGEQDAALELLRPQASLEHLPPGTAFHLLQDRRAVAKGQVLGHAGG